MLKLYNYYRSSASFRVRIALNLKGLAYQEVPVHLVKNGGEQHSESFKKINPHELVPALEEDDKVITQSLAIIEYLDEKYPLPKLLPTDIYLKALVRAFALSIAADLHPLNNLRVLTYLTNELSITEEQKKQWYQHWIRKGLAGLEKQLANSTATGNFCFGNLPTLADIFLVPQMYNARRFNCDVSEYPTLVRIDAHCQELSAFTDAWPMEEA